ncbi:hypothetical protein Lal_00026793 [Lupinus albus]|nr:hypothetical protein Lal_00026793 [Lupinus albus]
MRVLQRARNYGEKYCYGGTKARTARLGSSYHRHKEGHKGNELWRSGLSAATETTRPKSSSSKMRKLKAQN